MANQVFDRPVKQAAIWLVVALPFTLGACSAGTNCALLGLQCGAPTAEQESKAAAAEAAAKQEDSILGRKGHYGTPYGPGPQYGSGGGDQYGYGPGYSYAAQAPDQPTIDQQRQ